MNPFHFNDYNRLPHKLNITVKTFFDSQFILGYVPE